jgi:hypothetical protein
MGLLKKAVSKSYSISRKLNTLEKFASGSPKRIAKRYANKMVGKGVWRKLTWK